jgi:hypothetical protein
MISIKSSLEKRKKKKNFRNIWKICLKVLTFAPAFQTKPAPVVFRLRTVPGTFPFSFASLSHRETTRKKKKKKTSENIWKISDKVLTFASAF